MDKMSRFKDFLGKLREYDPALIEAISKGVSAMFESTEEKVEEIATELSIKPVSSEELSVPKEVPEKKSPELVDNLDTETRLQMEKGA